MSHEPGSDQFTLEETAPDEVFRYDESVDFLTAWFRRRGTATKTLLVVALPLAVSLTSAALGFFGLSVIEEGLKTGSAASINDAISQTEFLRTVLIASAIASTVLFLLVLSAVNKDIIRTSRQLIECMNRISGRDFNVEVPHQTRVDEYGELAVAIEQLRTSNIKLVEVEKAHQMRLRQDLLEQESARDERKAMLAEVAKQFEQNIVDVVGGVAASAAQLQTTAAAMAETADQANARTEDVSVSMEDANRGATAAAAASDEFAMSIGEISQQAANSAEMARKATVSTKEADATISNLADSAEEVGQIVELIQTIAQRTNLLALNASIEAARGGEAGRGFAVVASEVKELASQTSRATEKVADQIRAMQETTGASVSALRSIAEQVDQLEVTAVSIASAVDQQSVAGQDLARNIDMAASGTDKVSSHIEEVRELSLSTGAAASQVLASSTELDSQASSLREQVSSFLQKVRDG